MDLDTITIGKQEDCSLTGTYQLDAGGIKSVVLIRLGSDRPATPMAATLIVDDGGKWKALFPHAEPGQYLAVAVADNSQSAAKHIAWKPAWEKPSLGNGGVIVTSASQTQASGTFSSPTTSIQSGFHASDEGNPSQQVKFNTITNGPGNSWSATYDPVGTPSPVVAVGNVGVGTKEVS
jgi:hypothetical protein